MFCPPSVAWSLDDLASSDHSPQGQSLCVGLLGSEDMVSGVARVAGGLLVALPYVIPSVSRGTGHVALKASG